MFLIQLFFCSKIDSNIFMCFLVLVSFFMSEHIFFFLVFQGSNFTWGFTSVVYFFFILKKRNNDISYPTISNMLSNLLREKKLFFFYVSLR